MLMSRIHRKGHGRSNAGRRASGAVREEPGAGGKTRHGMVVAMGEKGNSKNHRFWFVYHFSFFGGKIFLGYSSLF